MSISTTIRQTQSTGNGVTYQYVCDFPIRASSDLMVYVDDDLKQEWRDYVLLNTTLNQSRIIQPGFTVQMTETPAAGTTVTIYRKTPYANPFQLQKKDEFSLSAVENAYDRLTMMFQDITDGLTDAVQSDITDFENPGKYPIPLIRYAVMASVQTSDGSGVYTLHRVKPDRSAVGEVRVIKEEGDGYLITAAEANGRTDVPISEVVMCLPIADSAGNVKWRFVAGPSKATALSNYEFFHVGGSYPSFVIDGTRPTGEFVYVGNVPDGGGGEVASPYAAFATIGELLDALTTDTNDVFGTFSSGIISIRGVVLDDSTVNYWTGASPFSANFDVDGSTVTFYGTGWRWRKTSKDVTTPKGSGTLDYLLGQDVEEAGFQPIAGLRNPASASKILPWDGNVMPFTTRLPYPENDIYHTGAKPVLWDNTPSPVDPDPCPDPDNPECDDYQPPVEPDPDVFVKYVQCDDTSVEIWRARRVAGVDVEGFDFSLIIEVGGNCYQATGTESTEPTGSVISESDITDTLADCSQCEAAPVSCPYASLEAGPPTVEFVMNINTGEAGFGAAAGATVVDFVTLGTLTGPPPFYYDRYRYFLTDHTGNCTWEANVEDHNNYYVNLSGQGSDTVIQWVAIAPNRTKLTFSGGEWKINLHVGMDDGAGNAVFHEVFFKRAFGGSPYGIYVPDTSAAAWLGPGASVQIKNPNLLALPALKTRVLGGGDTYIPRTHTDAQAKAAFEAGWAAGQNIYFDMDGDWQFSTQVTMTATNDGCEISWYDSGGGSSRPILRPETPTDSTIDPKPIIDIIISGNRDGLYVHGFTMDGRPAGVTDPVIPITAQKEWPLFRLVRQGDHTDSTSTNTITNYFFEDLECRYADGGIKLQDNISQQRYANAASPWNGITYSPGIGCFDYGAIRYCRFHHLNSKDALKNAIVLQGLRTDYGLTITQNAFYKIGFHDERSTLPSLKGNGEYDANRTSYGIYSQINTMAYLVVTANVFSDNGAMAAQLRSGGLFTDNFIVRTPTQIYVRIGGEVSGNIHIDAPDISPDPTDTAGKVVTTASIVAPLTVSENIFARPAHTRRQPVIEVPNSTVLENNLVCGYEPKTIDGYSVWINKGTPAEASSYSPSNTRDGNIILYGASATTQNAAFPTTHSRVWVETNLINRAFGSYVDTYTILTDYREALI